jgi:glycosyltransferase involved in cell wall biosynthesis
VGASGPGTDLSLYLARKLLGYDVVQLIHGPVACSRTIGWALLCATSVFYLQSTRDSLLNALKTVQPTSKTSDFLLDRKFQPFDNGLTRDQWPDKCISTTPKIFWAASLLKWKGLETLLESLKVIPTETRPESHICYIRPRSINLEMGPHPIDIEKVHWHENPSHLDQIRAECNIFISTSRSEPFGLSILESMAAGLAIVIPRDGAYWDQCLQNNINCLKYRADDSFDLALKIQYLQRNPEIIGNLGRKSKHIAQQYCTEVVYADIAHCLAFPKRGASNSRLKSYQCFDHAQV